MDIKSYILENKGAVKQLSQDRVGGLLVAWGSPNDKDLDGDYFTIETNFELDWYDQRPCLYDHATDGALKTKAIGTIDKIEIVEDMGLWAEAQIRNTEYYEKYISQWISEGRIGWSSGSIPQGVEIDKDGFIRTWPVVEGSLTLTPAQPLKTRVMPIKKWSNTEELEAAVKSLGIKNFTLDNFVLELDETTEEKETLTTLELEEISSDRPIQINLNMFNKKELTMNDNTTESVVESIGTTALETTTTELNVKEVAEPAGVDDSYFRNQVEERMFARGATLTSEQIDAFAQELKTYVCRKVYSSTPTEEEAGYARYDKDYQKLMNDLIDNANKKEEPKEDNTFSEVALLKARLEQFENMLGKGGVSSLPTVDSQVNQWGGGFIMDAEVKNQFSGYDPKDLLVYLQMRDHIVKNGKNEKPWAEEEQDALYNTIYNETKELRANPKFKSLMANRDWVETDNEQAEIRAYKAFETMDSYKGKWFKANEVNNSAIANGGAEWIYTFPDAVLWMTILEDHDLLSTIPSFNMVAGKVDWYIDDDLGLPGVIPEVRDDGSVSGESNQISVGGLYPARGLGTQKVQFEARHIGEQVRFSRILLEDSRVDVAASARSRIEESMQRGMVWAVLNADQTGDSSGNTTNYGRYDSNAEATTGTPPINTRLHNIGFQGLIGRALHPGGARTTANTTLDSAEFAGLRAGTQNCVDLMRRTYRMMNERYYANPERMCIVMRPSRQNKLWDLEEYRSAVTNVGQWDGGGRVMSFDGIPIKISEQVDQRDGNGRIHWSAANNEYDSIVFFRPDRMRIGIRRAMSTLMRIDGAWNEHFHYGKSLRWDFGIIPSNHNRTNIDNRAGTIRKPVAVLYGLTDTSD